MDATVRKAGDTNAKRYVRSMLYRIKWINKVQKNEENDSNKNSRTKINFQDKK